MATSQPTSATQQQESDFSFLPSLLTDAWDTGLGIFSRWVDHELGLGEVALAAESEAHSTSIAQHEAPSGGGISIAGQQFSLVTLGLVAGLGLVIFLLLRS